MVERARPVAVPPVNATRRRLISAATTLLVLPVVPRLAQAATLLAVRTWPADAYTRVTLELDSELKTEHFTLDNPDRLVVDIQGLTASHALDRLISEVRPNDPYIKSLRVAQNRPNVVRLVFDLKQAVAPQVFTLKPVADKLKLPVRTSIWPGCASFLASASAASMALRSWFCTVAASVASRVVTSVMLSRSCCTSTVPLADSCSTFCGCAGPLF